MKSGYLATKHKLQINSYYHTSLFPPKTLETALPIQSGMTQGGSYCLVSLCGSSKGAPGCGANTPSANWEHSGTRHYFVA